METSVNFCRITGSPLVCCFCRQKRGDLGVLSDVVYLKRQEGGSVQISCLSQDRSTSSIGFYLRKKCQNPEKEVLFLRSGARDRTVSPSFRDRLQLEGEPRENELNVTISLLQHGDTGLYHCEFIYEGSPLDRHVSGERDFFVFVERAEEMPSVEVVPLQTREGDSAVIPCPAEGTDSFMDGFCLKRKRTGAEVEVLYHSREQRHNGHNGLHQSRLQFERELSTQTYKLTISNLQRNESALYSCELLRPGKQENKRILGRRTYFISVQEPVCSCSSYPPLLYAISGGMALLLLIVAVLFGAHYGKQCCRSKPRAPVPIYEEMSGAKSPRRRAPCSFPDSSLLQETDTSVYVNPHARPPPHENYYVSPSHVPADSKD
ncbi:cd7 antigen-like isoform X1 [Lepisosteus oculatus]|uniref:cd7 antigen-like isoform X1 n=1 Tax=Lepisosteus oculatus TaxID=7918 RepID=UPI00371080A5